MVVDTIQSIKDTEKKADEIMKQADQESKDILTKATQEASKLKEDAKISSTKKAAADLEEAKAQGNQVLQQQEENTKNEIKGLNEKVKEKENEAIQLILEGLV